MPGKQLYHYTPTVGVRADFKRLMNDFISAKTVRYEVFSEIWRKRKLSFLCAGRHSYREGREFVERALLIALEFFLPPYQFQVRVGGLYLLYGVFMTQPIVPKVKVRLTSHQWRDTMQFHQDASQQNHLDVVYIFNKMIVEQAFQFCYTPSEMNERTLNPGIAEDEEINLADEMKEERREINQLFNYESMEQLSYLLDHYRQMKVSMAGPKADKPDKSLDVIQGSLVEDVVAMLQSFKENVGNIHKHGTAEAKDKTSNEPGTSKSEGSILSKRLAIKAKSFAGLADGSPKKSFVGTDVETKDACVDASSTSQVKGQKKSVHSKQDSDEEDVLEDFVSSSSRRKRQKDSPKKSLPNNNGKDKNEIEKNPQKPESPSSKKSQSLDPLQCQRKLNIVSTESGSQVELKYIESVAVCSKRGVELSAKLGEIARDASASKDDPGKRNRGARLKLSAGRRSPRKRVSTEVQCEIPEHDADLQTTHDNTSEIKKRRRGRTKVLKAEGPTAVPSTCRKKSDEGLKNPTAIKNNPRKRGNSGSLDESTNCEMDSPTSYDEAGSFKQTVNKRKERHSKSREVSKMTEQKKETINITRSRKRKLMSPEEEHEISSGTQIKRNVCINDSPVIQKKQKHSSSQKRSQSSEQSETESPPSDDLTFIQDDSVQNGTKSIKQPADRKRMGLRQSSVLKTPERYVKQSSGILKNGKVSKVAKLSESRKRNQSQRISQELNGEKTAEVLACDSKAKANTRISSLSLNPATQSESAKQSAGGANVEIRRKKTVETVSKCEGKKQSTFKNSFGKTGIETRIDKNKNQGAVFNITKSPLSRIIGGNREPSTSPTQSKKPPKIIKIVTKGLSEAQEVLKALEKQKASGKKLLEDLPSHCVQAITVGCNSGSKSKLPKEVNVSKNLKPSVPVKEITPASSHSADIEVKMKNKSGDGNSNVKGPIKYFVI